MVDEWYHVFFFAAENAKTQRYDKSKFDVSLRFRSAHSWGKCEMTTKWCNDRIDAYNVSSCFRVLSFLFLFVILHIYVFEFFPFRMFTFSFFVLLHDYNIVFSLSCIARGYILVLQVHEHTTKIRKSFWHSNKLYPFHLNAKLKYCINIQNTTMQQCEKAKKVTIWQS
jgi:hypothetical protein